MYQKEQKKITYYQVYDEEKEKAKEIEKNKTLLQKEEDKIQKEEKPKTLTNEEKNKMVTVRLLVQELKEVSSEAIAIKHGRVGWDNIDKIQDVIEDLKFEIEYYKQFKKFTDEKLTRENKIKMIEFLKTL